MKTSIFTGTTPRQGLERSKTSLTLFPRMSAHAIPLARNGSRIPRKNQSPKLPSNLCSLKQTLGRTQVKRHRLYRTLTSFSLYFPALNSEIKLWLSLRLLTRTESKTRKLTQSTGKQT